MSYVDPRAGHSSGDDSSGPSPYGYGPDRYAGAWHAEETSVTQQPITQQPITQQPITQQPVSEQPITEQPVARGRRRAKAGRNLPAAIAVGVGLCLIVLASLVIWSPAFIGVIVIVAGVGVWEMTRALRAGGADAPLIPLLAGGVLMTGLTSYGGTDALLLGLVATVLAAAVWRISDGAAAFRRDFTASVLIAVYVPFLLSFAIVLQQPDPDQDGRWRILCTLLAVVLSDTGGYATGVFLGRHKMAPSISPGKTWEGFGGSIFFSAVGSSLLLFFLLDIPIYWGLLFGAVLSVVAVVGDLSESMLKRDLGVKDMSNLLPGHGGVMDRLDSIVFAVPAAYLLFALIAANS